MKVFKYLGHLSYKKTKVSLKEVLYKCFFIVLDVQGELNSLV